MHREAFDIPNCSLSRMNAVKLGFCNGVFDCVVCSQNGISAFHVDQQALVSESVRMAKAGAAFFSQVTRKGSGRIDSNGLNFSQRRDSWEKSTTRRQRTVSSYARTASATMVSSDHFLALTAQLDADVRIVEVDE